MGFYRSTGVSFANVFAVVKRQSECGRKTSEMHCLPRLHGISQPMNVSTIQFPFDFNRI